MKTLLPLLSLLTAIRPSRGTSSDATIDGASGEASIVSCVPKPFLNGTQSTCDTFAISTLSSPRRCIHIEAPVPEGDEDDGSAPEVCTDFPGWHDGTNGCGVYAERRNADWCDMYGGSDYPATPHKPNEACCVCGGGKRARPRMRRGDLVRLTGYGQLDACKSLKIVEHRTNPYFHYRIEVMKECGPPRLVRDKKTGYGRYEPKYQPGTVVSVSSDEPGVIDKHTRVELRKCRPGKAEQEFGLTPVGNEGGKGGEMVMILHSLMGDISTTLGGKSPLFNLTQVFEDGLFDGSGELFHILMITDANEGRLNEEWLPYGPSYSYLGSGKFGETEYSEVRILPVYDSNNAHSGKKGKGFEEEEFSMWQFRPFVKGESHDGPSALDEHSEWLVRMTQLIGIDYLEQLPPWHLLDVERDASRGEVKARFRELSKFYHPDKLVNRPEKKDLYERIFLLLQDAYQNLKGSDEARKEEFRVRAESGSQLFAHSRHVVELLPFHWTEIGDGDGAGDGDDGEGGGRYILNVASHLNSTLSDDAPPDEEAEPSVQIWVTFMYSARCGMSKSVVGMVDLAARHLERHENVKVGGYGCGLYKDHPTTETDPIGVRSDPICAQFGRGETPNVHVIIETLPGRRRDENGILTEVPPDAGLVKENAQFKYFYAAVPHGNTTQFFPHNLVDFAKAGKRVWQNSHLVHRMTASDFASPEFVGSASIVAYLDGTGEGDTSAEVVEAIANSLPGVARRFLADDVYVGVARCGYGDEHADEDDAESQKQVDCSKLGVSWLPDIKMYAVNETEGISLLRGRFGDIRDVQIALESMGNVIRMMVGGKDDDFEDDFEEMEDDDNAEEAEGGCDSNQPPPPPFNNDLDLDEIEGQKTPLLEMEEEEEVKEAEPALEAESKPALERGAEKLPRQPKLASEGDKPRLEGGRERTARDRISGFHQRETKKAGSGQLLGGGASGSAGFIA